MKIWAGKKGRYDEQLNPKEDSDTLNIEAKQELPEEGLIVESVSLKTNIKIRSWRDVYQQLYAGNIEGQGYAIKGKSLGDVKKKTLEETVSTYGEEIESIAKWVRTHLKAKVQSYHIEDTNGVTVLDVGEDFPTFPHYFVLGGALFIESSKGLVEIDGKTFRRIEKDDRFYKVIVYENIYQELVENQINSQHKLPNNT